MLDIDKSQTISALIKWVSGEPLSSTDFERIINVFDKCPLNADIADQAKWAGLQVRFRSILHERFMPKGQ